MKKLELLKDQLLRVGENAVNEAWKFIETLSDQSFRPFMLIVCDRFDREPPAEPVAEESSYGASNLEDLNFFHTENSRKVPEDRKVSRKSLKPARKEIIPFAQLKASKRSYNESMPIGSGLSPSRKRGMMFPNEPVTNSMQAAPSDFSRLIADPPLNKASKSLAKVGFTGIVEPSKSQAMFSKKKAPIRSANSFHSNVPKARAMAKRNVQRKQKKPKSKKGIDRFMETPIETIQPKVSAEDELSGAGMQVTSKTTKTIVTEPVQEEDSDDEILCPPTPEKEGGTESCPVGVSDAARKL